MFAVLALIAHLPLRGLKLLEILHLLRYKICKLKRQMDNIGNLMPKFWALAIENDQIQFDKDSQDLDSAFVQEAEIIQDNVESLLLDFLSRKRL
jgi:hypothetical protein